jgi:hypothetical protein
VLTRPRRVQNKPVWMNREVIRAVRKERRLWKHAGCDGEEMAKCKDAEMEATKKIRNAKRNFEPKLAREKHNKSRPFYLYLKDKTRSREDLLNDYFASVFTQEGDSPVPEEELLFNSELQDIYISVDSEGKNSKTTPKLGP